MRWGRAAAGGPVVGLSAGLHYGLDFGWRACQQHLALRLLLWRNGYFYLPRFRASYLYLDRKDWNVVIHICHARRHEGVPLTLSVFRIGRWPMTNAHHHG